MTAMRVFAVALAVMLAGCAGLPSATAETGTATVPSAARPVNAGGQVDFASELRARLNKLATQDEKVPLQSPARDDGLPALRLDGDAFHGDSGELTASMLTPLSELVQLLPSTGACVVHVIGERVGGADSPAADLGERRAAAVAAVLGSFGVPAANLRYESRIEPGHAGGVMIVVRPVIEGHEEQAWMPPPVEGGS